jgi:uncharacterized repeat protein (TIGR02543 family)
MKYLIFILSATLMLLGCKKKDDKQTPTSKYSVTYNGNNNTGGTAPVDGLAYDNGNTATVMGNDGILTKTGFYFTGWNTEANGSGTSYTPSSTLTVGSSDITLYAKWTSNTSGNLYNIYYNGNGNTSGSVPVDNTYYTFGTNAIVKSNSGNLSKNGYAFQSWNTSSIGFGQSFSPGSSIAVSNNIVLYAIYSTSSGGSGSYYGFNASAQLKSKSSLTSSWSSADLNNTFGSSNIVTAVWNGSKFVGFNASGQCKSKSSTTSSWSSEDLNNTFGSSNIVAAVWNGSKYIGFNASGQCKSKSSLTSSWSSEDLSNTFGSSSVVSVVWNGSKYIGFNASGQCKSKSTLTSSWSSEDLNNTFGSSSVVAVAWNGSKYIGFNASGQCKSKSSLTSSWSSEDLNNTFGSSSVVTVVYH